MGALGLVLRAEFRRRWRSWLALAALIAVVSGLVLFATAAGRRTASAFPRFLAAHGYDAEVYHERRLPALARLPTVASAVEVLEVANGQPTCTCKRLINSDDFTLGWVPAKALDRLTQLVSGHMPDQSSPDQVLASFTMEQDYGVRVGTVVRVPLYAASQLAALNNAVAALPPAKGPTVSLHVVGVEAAEIEFPSGQTPVYDLFATAAFDRSVLPRTATFAGLPGAPAPRRRRLSLVPSRGQGPRRGGRPQPEHARCARRVVGPPPGGRMVGARRAGGPRRLGRDFPGPEPPGGRGGAGVPHVRRPRPQHAPARAARHGANRWRSPSRRGGRCHHRCVPFAARTCGRSTLGRGLEGPLPRRLGTFRRWLGHPGCRGHPRAMAGIAGSAPAAQRRRGPSAQALCRRGGPERIRSYPFHGGRGAPCPRTRQWPDFGPGRHRVARQRPGGRCALCHRGLRRQPFAPHGHACPLRR